MRRLLLLLAGGSAKEVCQVNRTNPYHLGGTFTVRVQMQSHTPEQVELPEYRRQLGPLMDVMQYDEAVGENKKHYDVFMHTRYGYGRHTDQVEEAALEWTSDDNLYHTMIVARGPRLNGFLNYTLSLRNHTELLHFLHQHHDEKSVQYVYFPTHMEFPELIDETTTVPHVNDSDFVRVLPLLSMMEVYTGIVVRLSQDQGTYHYVKPHHAEATKKLDIALSRGFYLLITATDDAHDLRDIGQAWINVFFDRKFDPESEVHRRKIIHNIMCGNFYPTTGVLVDSLRRVGDIIEIGNTNAHSLRVIGHQGFELLTSTLSNNDTYRYHITEAIKLKHRFIRFEFFGHQKDDQDRHIKAWTQAFQTRA